MNPKSTSVGAALSKQKIQDTQNIFCEKSNNRKWKLHENFCCFREGRQTIHPVQTKSEEIKKKTMKTKKYDIPYNNAKHSSPG